MLDFMDVGESVPVCKKRYGVRYAGRGVSWWFVNKLI